MSHSEDAKKSSLWPFNAYFPFNMDNPLYTSWPSAFSMPLINHFNMPLSGAVQQSIANRMDNLEAQNKAIQNNICRIDSNVSRIASNEKLIFKILSHLNSAVDSIETYAQMKSPADIEKEKKKLKEELELELEGLKGEKRDNDFMSISGIIRKVRIEHIETILKEGPKEKPVETLKKVQERIKNTMAKIEEQKVLSEESLIDKLKVLKKKDQVAYEKVMSTLNQVMSQC